MRIALLLLPCLAACAAGPGRFLKTPEAPLGWPAEDPQPRITFEFLYHGLDDTDRSPGFWTSLGHFVLGEEPRRLGSPYGMALDSLGKELWIADTGYGVLHRLDLETGDHRLVDGGEDHRLQTPVGIALLPDGRFAVTDSTRGEVLLFDDEGEVDAVFGDPETLGRPTGLCWDAFGSRLLVMDTVGGRVLAYDLDGRQLLEAGAAGDMAGYFNHPTNLAVAADGEVFLTDSLNFRVQVFDQDLHPLREFGIAGNGPGTFAKPKGIALDSEGHVYVVDAMFDNIQIFDRGGTLLMTFGQSGQGFAGFHLPSGILITADDRIFISDSGNSRIQVFRYHPRTSTP